MPEIKHSFTGGKMNKDLDERLLKNGEYRHATNIQVRTTDSQSDDGVGNTGTVQNLQGNELMGSAYYENWMSSNIDPISDENGNVVVNSWGTQRSPKCIANVADEKNDRGYFFYASYPYTGKSILTNGEFPIANETTRHYVDSIWEQSASGTKTPVLIDNYTTVSTFFGIVQGYGENTNPYLATGWSEIYVTDTTHLRAGMKVNIYQGNGTNVVDDEMIIKAVDHDSNTILFHEAVYVTLDPSVVAFIIFRSPRVLNFTPGSKGGVKNIITGVNVIDDFIIWTDGYSEPKKINIPRSKAGTNISGILNDGKTHTKLFLKQPDTDEFVDANTLNNPVGINGNSDGGGWDTSLKEEHVTVIRKSPRSAPTLIMKDVERANVFEITGYSFVSEDSNGGVVNIGEIKRITDVAFESTAYRPNDILNFQSSGQGDQGGVMKGKFICYEDGDGNEVSYTTSNIRISLVKIFPTVGSQFQQWEITLEKKKPLFELKLGRFGYRYKYEDGEYSSFSPWSELAFLPSDFDYVISKAYNLGMTNTVRELVIKDFIPYKIPLDVASVDILYKTTNSANVYILETIDKVKSPEWELYTPTGDEDIEIKTGELVITSEMIHRVLSSTQTLRSWDNVPRYAKSQEIVGNRLLFANYIQGFDLKNKVNLTQNVTSEEIPTTETSQPPHKSIKSIRDYKVGMVFGDKYGRETPVMTGTYAFTATAADFDGDGVDDDVEVSTTGDITVEKTLSANQNSLVVKQSWDNNPDSWIDYVKYYVKETSNEYYNLIMDRWYDSGDGTVWLSFNSADRNKVDEETYLILKNKHGSQEPILEKARYKIIAIENEAPDYIKETKTILGEAGAVSQADNCPGCGGLDESAVSTDEIWLTGQGANTAPPDGLMNNTTCIISAGHWNAAGFSVSATTPASFDQTGGVGKVYMRVVGKSWKQDDAGLMYNAFQRNSKWVLLTNYRATNGGSSVRLTWAEKFYQDADMYSFWGTSGGGEVNDINGNDLVVADLVYSIEFMEVETQNKPEFDGKFFVKIEQDLVLRQGVMSYGLNNQWLPQATYSLAYISSTVDNEGNSGPYISTPAVFGQSVNGTTDAYDDGDSYSWFQYKYPNVTMSRNTSTGAWESDGSASLFENRVLSWCGVQAYGKSWGPYDLSSAWSTQSWVNHLGDAIWDGSYNAGYFSGYSSGDQSWGSDFRGFESCTCIGSSANGGSVTQTWYDPSNFPCGSTYTGGAPCADNGGANNYIELSKFRNEDSSDEFNVLANKGVMGSCTHHANNMTKGFWGTYKFNNGPTRIKYWNGDFVPIMPTGFGFDGEQEGGGALAFIDGAKARYMNFDSETVESPNFYRPKSLDVGESGIYNGTQTYGQMTISRLEDCSDDCKGLYDMLTGGGATFRFGAQDTVYEVYSVEFTTGRTTNYSTGFTGNLRATVDFGGSIGEQEFDAPDLLLEQCKPCDEGYYTGVNTNGHPHPFNSYDTTEYSSFFGEPEYLSYYTSGSGAHFDGNKDYPECFRRSAIIRFQRLDIISGLPILADDGTSLVGLDITSYDPRGQMHHDGRDSIAIVEVKPVPIIYNDDSNKNELGACWETEPKEDTDLDIYYEASNAIPLVLNEDNVFDFVPINSGIQSFRETDDGITEVEVYTGGGGGGAYTNIRVANVHMSTDSDQAIVCVIRDGTAGTAGLGVLHTYDLWNLATPHLNIDDWMVITHPNGTVTRAKVENFWELIDDSPGTTIFEDIENPGETGSIFMDTQLLSGPKAFRKTSVPTGYYGISINVSENEVKLPWFNCYSFGNGVESDRIRDDYNAPQIDNGVRVSTTFSGYGEEKIGSGLIYSGLYNSTSQVNDLNEFNMSQKITKELNPSYGSIQRLKARDTDMVVFTEDKVLRLLANKDAVFNADGNPQLTATDRVLGTPVPFVGDYGISKNPESLAWDQYRMYFTDKQRGAVLRLSRDGLTPISNVGMRSWFRNNIRNSGYLVGSFDTVQGEYNLSLETNVHGFSSSTISFNEASKGWVSFKSFMPDQGMSIAGKYITAKDNSTWLHNSDNVTRNNFYNSGPSTSVLKFIFNEQNDVVKSFKAINYTGSQARINQFLGANVISYTGEVETTADAPPTFENIVASLTQMIGVTDNQHDNLVDRRGWYVSDIKTDLEEGSVVDFKNKEGKWFQGISGKQVSWSHGTHLNIQTDQFSVQGIGVVGNVAYIADDDIDGNEDDCVPPCPIGYTCIEGDCVETYQEVLGCMDENASNYCGPGSGAVPECNTPNNTTCIYNVTGCMDPMAPNYNSLAESTVDNSTGTIGDFDWTYYSNGYPTCWPLCTDCESYQYGCNLTMMSGMETLNYSAGNTTDGYCEWEGVVVPCPPSQILDSSLDGYNGDAWSNEDDMGKIDAYIVEPGYSCVIQNCPDPDQIWTPGCTDGEEECCTSCVYGCTDSAYDNYDPSATCDDGTCYSDNYVLGCMDPTACNYNPDATQQEQNSCDFFTCVGCLDPLAYNYNGPDAPANVNNPSLASTIACDDCCCYEGQQDCAIPGCLDPMYQEFCGDDPGNENPTWLNLGMPTFCSIPCWAGGPCGEYTADNGSTQFLGNCNTPIFTGVLGCMDDGSGWETFPYTVEVNNYDMAATEDDGSCTYTIYACLDENDYNYPSENWVGWNPNFTAINDATLCDNAIVQGCMDSNATNYNPLATENDGSCVPEIHGCTDPTAINYSPWHTDPTAGYNNYSLFTPPEYSGTWAGNSWEYSGECMYWTCGCIDQYASNYDPNANTQIQMNNYTISGNWYNVSNAVSLSGGMFTNYPDVNEDGLFFGTYPYENVQIYQAGTTIAGGYSYIWFPANETPNFLDLNLIPCDGFTGCEYDTYAPQTMIVENYVPDTDEAYQDELEDYTGQDDT